MKAGKMFCKDHEEQGCLLIDRLQNRYKKQSENDTVKTEDYEFIDTHTLGDDNL